MALGFKEDDISEIANDTFRFLTEKGVQSIIYPSNIDGYTLEEEIRNLFGKEKPISPPKIVQKENSNQIQQNTNKTISKSEEKEKQTNTEKSEDIFNDDDFDIPSDDDQQIPEETTKAPQEQKTNENIIQQKNPTEIIPLHQLADKTEHFMNLIAKWNQIGKVAVDFGQQHLNSELHDTEYGNYKSLETLSLTSYGSYKIEREKHLLGLPELIQEDLDEISKHPSLFDSFDQLEN